MDPLPSQTTNDPAGAVTPPGGAAAGDVYDRVAAKADEIEAEMKRIGCWQVEPIPAGAMQFKEPFAADTMTFRQWLQFVFLPKVRDMVRRRQEVPNASTVGSHAVGALEADLTADQLVSLLTEFDALFGTPQVEYGPSGRRSRFGPAMQAAGWTVVMVATGVLCVGYGSRLAPKDRQERYSFAVHEPASGGYESIDLTATAAGPAGRLRPEEMQLRLFRDSDTPPGGDMAVDLLTHTYHYAETNGQTRSGGLDAEAVVAWMYQCGVSAHPANLNPEAVALVGFVDEVGHDPAGTFDRLRQSGDSSAAARPFRLSAVGNFGQDLPGTLPLSVRAGVPAGMWAVGLGVIALVNRRRTAGAGGGGRGAGVG